MKGSDASGRHPRYEFVEDVNIYSCLRNLMPRRALSWTEAHSIAERQAALLLDLVHICEPPVPMFVISSIPGIVVDWRHNWPTSGMAIADGYDWRIVLNATEPRWRRRFTLAHEFKHVLDDPVADGMSRHLPARQRPDRAERLCNYFAACLLMPRPWVKHDWYGGMQDVQRLAKRYYVSTEAMTTRLSELGLTPITLSLEKRHRHLGAA